MSRKTFALVLALLLLSAGTPAQTEGASAAPVRWERYRVADKNISLSLPKMPILVSRSESCSQQEARQYASYAADAVYGLNIVFKRRTGLPSYCTNVRSFDAPLFHERLDALKMEMRNALETKLKLNGRDAVRLEGGEKIYWLVNDFENRRWFELWVFSEDKTRAEIKDFAESFRLEKDAAGVEIGDGASRVLGDESAADPATDAAPDNTAAAGGAAPAKDVRPLRIIMKPRPEYSEAARKKLTSGVVRLKVTFLANGGIGAVAPVSGLADGLTEQAIAAAQKIVFIPAKVNDRPMTVTRTVEYSFSIY